MAALVERLLARFTLPAASCEAQQRVCNDDTWLLSLAFFFVGFCLHRGVRIIQCMLRRAPNQIQNQALYRQMKGKSTPQQHHLYTHKVKLLQPPATLNPCPRRLPARPLLPPLPAPHPGAQRAH